METALGEKENMGTGISIFRIQWDTIALFPIVRL
jgi:hypothetical protein